MPPRLAVLNDDLPVHLGGAKELDLDVRTALENELSVALLSTPPFDRDDAFALISQTWALVKNLGQQAVLWTRLFGRILGPTDGDDGRCRCEQKESPHRLI